MTNTHDKYKDSILVFIFTLACCLFAYGFALSNHTISIDVDGMDNFIHTINLGRWAHALLKVYVLHEPWVPFFSLAFSIICISASAVLISSHLKMTLNESLMFSCLFATFPQFAYQLQFTNQSDSFGIGLLLCTYSTVRFSYGGFLNYIFFFLINVFVISIYQSFALLPATLIAVFYLYKAASGNCELKKWFISSVLISLLTIVSAIGSIVISKFVKQHYGITDVSYFASMISWGNSDFKDAISGLWGFIYYNCFTQTWYGLNFYILTIISTIAIIIASIKRGIICFYTTVVLSLVVIISPFILNILIGSGTPARTLNQMPLVFGITIMLGLRLIKRKAISNAIVAIILLSSFGYINLLFYSDKVADDQTRMISEQIMSDVYHHYPELINKDTPLYMSGRINIKNLWKQYASDDFGISFYERGVSIRTVSYIENRGIANVTPVDERDLNDNQKNNITSLKKWPAEDSIKVVDGMILVRLPD